MNVSNEVVIVTGANRGLGAQLVHASLENGARKIYAAARDITSLPDFQDNRVIPLELDVIKAESVQQAAVQAQDVTLLVNNAGVLSFGDILSVTEADIRHNLEVNFFGTLRVVRAFTPALANQKNAAVVNVLTLLSLASMPGLSAYNASKAAAWSLHLSLRATLAEHGIAVHGVFPGAVDTDMLKGVEMAKTSPVQVASAILAGVEAEQEDIFPDPMSREVYAAWAGDHKSVEKQFASM